MKLLPCLHCLFDRDPATWCILFYELRLWALWGKVLCTKREMCSLYCKYKCRPLNSMECDSCTRLGWMDSCMHFWNPCKMWFFGLGDRGGCLFPRLVCVSFVSPTNVPLSSLHLLWSCFFLHLSLPVFGLQRFPKCKGKKLKSCFFWAVFEVCLV